MIIGGPFPGVAAAGAASLPRSPLTGRCYTLTGSARPTMDTVNNGNGPQTVR